MEAVKLLIERGLSRQQGARDRMRLCPSTILSKLTMREMLLNHSPQNTDCWITVVPSKEIDSCSILSFNCRGDILAASALMRDSCISIDVQQEHSEVFTIQEIIGHARAI